MSVRFFIIIIILFLSSCSLNKVVKHHGIHYLENKQKSIDDYQFGGGAGMVMNIQPIDDCISELKSKRKYYFIANKNKLEIYFFENPKTLFQRFELKSKGNTLIGKATHQCGSDHYASEYIFKTDGCFEITHKVRGPKKKYSSKTIYSKIIN